MTHRIHPDRPAAHACAMLSADGQPPGTWGDAPLTYQTFDEWPEWLKPLLAQAEMARPYARLARHMPVENFDGALISSEMIALVVDAHGSDVALLWARGDVEYESRSSAGEVAPATPVFVWGDEGRLVAMCAPLDGSSLAPRTILGAKDRAALLADVEDAIHREAEAFGDEDIAAAIVTVAGVAIDSLRAT